MQKQFSKLTIHNQDFEFADISSIANIEQIPFSYRILIENILRQKINGDDIDADKQIDDILNYKLGAAISFMPNRILSHDILGKVMLVDFLAYREALQKKGIDPKDIQPKVPVDVVIDHSLQVDFLLPCSHFFNLLLFSAHLIHVLLCSPFLLILKYSNNIVQLQPLHFLSSFSSR